ncbi:hypothetical protein BpHYR1_027072 [Brachionus plicatilis]|uniref:Uncharacterized protein n=1 Tax=Brachionus plicatilis TaxID=10195 RepID=A0A3M7R6P6_BRAPC|nr:hypothetical protein BpHYR1_027072 [Brachionus plicatilis]
MYFFIFKSKTNNLTKIPLKKKQHQHSFEKNFRFNFLLNDIGIEMKKWFIVFGKKGINPSSKLI